VKTLVLDIVLKYLSREREQHTSQSQ